jgi:Tol biopolymer transport system component
VDGSGLLQLTTDRAPAAGVFSFNDVAPTWPAGRITFQSDRDGNDEIYTINAMDGANPIRITNNAAFDLRPRPFIRWRARRLGE